MEVEAKLVYDRRQERPHRASRSGALLFAKRMGATHGRRSSAGHVPMLSHPDVVIDVIRAAANAVSRSRVAAA